MSRGYGKYRRGGHSHTSFHFDNLFKENSNRPSAARSAATVGKWGITSFTSIRTANGLAQENEKAKDNVPKPKKFFKSRNTDPPDVPTSTYKRNSKSNANYEPPKKTKLSLSSLNNSERTTRSSNSNKKFFSTKSRTISSSSSNSSNSSTHSNSPEKTVLNSSNVNNNTNETITTTATVAAPPKPPIVLRICRGKSQLINDSDESESTPTPSSTPSTSSNVIVTSPKSVKDPPPAAVIRTSNCRITRSARRSMQQDPSSSPATADTPGGEFSLFTSPRKEAELDLSPQYIPAEKYELERRAMYDNLLKPNSPKPDSETEHDNNVDNNNTATTDDLTQIDIEEDDSLMESNRITTKNDECIIEEEPPLLLEKQIIEPPNIVNYAVVEPPKNIEDEWSTDSNNSNSTHEEPPLQEEEEEEIEAPQINPIVPEVEIKEDDDERLEEEEIVKGEDIEPPEEQLLLQESIPKLVISKKKGSIFKSRSLVNDGTTKRRALYKHKWSDDTKDTKTNETTTSIKTPSEVLDSLDFADDPLIKISKSGNENGNESDAADEITSVKCTKGDKEYYTVVRNVKKAHQMQEIGEFQEFNDDVEYILDALQDNNPISTRCLSAITLASKCMAPAFRMHVRAHGTVAKFFKALHDATKDQSLGLCTATVMFVLSQDRLNMDLDRDCLELMLNLLESDVSYQQALDVCGLSSAQLEKNKQKVRELCAEMQGQGHAIHLNLDNITVGQLAMETLLSLTSKRAGEWFKEELRELGGLEHIMKTICECCRQVSDYVVSWTDVLLDKLRKVDRCLRVLENVTHNNEENQTYLLKYNDGIILDTLVNLYKLCDGEIPLYPVTDISDKESTGTIIREALLVTLKVLITLTHHFNERSVGSSLIGQRVGIIETSLHLLLQVPHYIPDQKKFELGVLVLMLLINLIQDNEQNKRLLMDAKAPSKLESIYSREESAVEALIAQFYDWEQCAEVAENRTNAILDGEKDDDSKNVQYKSNEEFIEETVAKLLQKAGTHMEYTFLASYIVLLIGFLVMDNEEYQKNIRQFLKGNNFTDMVALLNKFYNFMNLTASTEASSVCAIKATKKVIKLLEDCDSPTKSFSVSTTIGTTSTTSSTSFTGCMDLSYTVPH